MPKLQNHNYSMKVRDICFLLVIYFKMNYMFTQIYLDSDHFRNLLNYSFIVHCNYQVYTSSLIPHSIACTVITAHQQPY